MADSLIAHLSRLPRPQLERITHAVLGRSLNGTPPDTASLEIARRLLDPNWVETTLTRLGPDARAALDVVARAGVPVLRGDVSAFVAAHDADPVDALEEYGLLTPVRTGRGMPTHVALPPGLTSMLSERPNSTDTGVVGKGPAFVGTRRRFDLALLLAAVGQHPPRLTRTGRLHVADLSRLAENLAPLGLHAAALERRLQRWLDIGVARQDGALRPIPAAFSDVTRLWLTLAISQLSAPSIPDGTLRIVARLLETSTALPLRTAIDAAQVSLLRDRSDTAGAQRGARSELVDVIRALLSLDAIVLQEADGTPLIIDDATLFSLGERQPMLVLEPLVQATLLNQPLPVPTFARGHVQSSFEIVADSGCDPTLVARIALWSRLERADRAAVLKLERAAVGKAKALGHRIDDLLAALTALSGQSVPLNVSTLARDWFNHAPDGATPTPGELPDLAVFVSAAQAALKPEL